MLKKLNLLAIAALVAVTLGGCAIRTQDTRVDLAQIDNKAMVIMKINHVHKGWLYDLDKHVTNIWSRIDKAYFGENKLSYEFFPRLFHSNGNAYMVEPGNYVLDKISFQDGSSSYYSPNPGLLPDLTPLFPTFHVEAGEIIYLGDIDVDVNDNQHFVFKVQDNFEEAKKEFQKAYPGITKPIQKRLLDPHVKLKRRKPRTKN